MQPFCKKVNKVISKFDINIHGLEEKTYEYEFEGSDSFFEYFEQEIIEGGNFKINLSLDKSSTLIRLKFDINANLKLVCDRSLEEFEENFLIEEKYIYKFGEKAQFVSDEIETIPFGTPKINVAEHIFDFIMLRVPMKKLHPKFRIEEDEEDEDGKLIYVDPHTEENIKTDGLDPRWAALLKIKNLD